MTSYLGGRGWPFEEDGHEVASVAIGQNGQWPVRFEIREDDGLLLVYSIVSSLVPQTRRLAVALYLTRVNHGLAIGNFEFDLDSGEVRYKTSVDIEGAALEEPIVDHLLLANIVAVDRYLAGMRAVVDGADPDDSADAADQVDQPF